MDDREAHDILYEALAAARCLSYGALLARAPVLRGRTKLLGVTLSETYEPVEGGYSYEMITAPSGKHYNVSTEVFWSNYTERVIGVMVCIDDGGESARRPLCESIEFDLPRK